MILYSKIISCTCIFLLSLATVCSQDFLDYNNSRKYADYLYQTHQYDLAKIEYERVIFLEPHDSLAKLKLIRTYRYLKNSEFALERIANFFPGGIDNMPIDFASEYLKIIIGDGQYENAQKFIQNCKTLDSMTKAEFQLGILIMQHRWSEAKIFAGKQVDLPGKTEKFHELIRISENGMNSNYKSPILAASLSALVPGSGKLYSGRWKDAIFSFIFVASSSWLSYKTIEDKGFKVDGIIYGSVALGFYAANVYGSFKSAKSFNGKINKSFSNEAGTILLNGKE